MSDATIVATAVPSLKGLLRALESSGVPEGKRSGLALELRHMEEIIAKKSLQRALIRAIANKDSGYVSYIVKTQDVTQRDMDNAVFCAYVTKRGYSHTPPAICKDIVETYSTSRNEQLKQRINAFEKSHVRSLRHYESPDQ